MERRNFSDLTFNNQSGKFALVFILNAKRIQTKSRLLSFQRYY